MKHSLLLLLSVLIGFSCSKNEPVQPTGPIVIDKPTVSLHYNESVQFSATKATVAVDPASINWSINDTYVGKISTTGKFTASHIGSAAVSGISTLTGETIKSAITVIPYSTLFVEPLASYGTSKASIKLQEQRVVLKDGGSILYYNGDNSKIRYVAYLFDNDKMTSALVALATTTDVAKEAATFLLERYSVVSQTSDGYYVFSDLKTTSPALKVDAQLGPVIIYAPYQKGGRKVDIKIMNSLITKSNKQLY